MTFTSSISSQRLYGGARSWVTYGAGQIGFAATPPDSYNLTTAGVVSFSMTALATADATGVITGAGSGLQLSNRVDVDAMVTLN